MCGGSANSRCLPSIENGERTRPTDVHAAARDRRGPAAQRLVAGRRLEPDPVRRAPADDQQVPALGHRAAAIAERLAALQRVHVEHGGPDPQRPAVAEPQVGADAGPDREVGIGRAQPWPARRRVRWLTKTVRVGRPVATTSLRRRSTSPRWRACVERQVHRHAREPGEPSLAERPRPPRAARGGSSRGGASRSSCSSTNRASGRPVQQVARRRRAG